MNLLETVLQGRAFQSLILDGKTEVPWVNLEDLTRQFNMCGRLSTKPARNKEKGVIVLWPRLQTQRHLSGVVARHSRREEKMRKA